MHPEKAKVRQRQMVTEKIPKISHTIVNRVDVRLVGENVSHRNISTVHVNLRRTIQNSHLFMANGGMMYPV